MKVILDYNLKRCEVFYRHDEWYPNDRSLNRLIQDRLDEANAWDLESAMIMGKPFSRWVHPYDDWTLHKVWVVKTEGTALSEPDEISIVRVKDD